MGRLLTCMHVHNQSSFRHQVNCACRWRTWERKGRRGPIPWGVMSGTVPVHPCDTEPSMPQQPSRTWRGHRTRVDSEEHCSTLSRGREDQNTRRCCTASPERQHTSVHVWPGPKWLTWTWTRWTHIDLSLGVAGLNIPNKQQLVVLTGDLELQDLNVHHLKKR